MSEKSNDIVDDSKIPKMAHETTLFNIRKKYKNKPLNVLVYCNSSLLDSNSIEYNHLTNTYHGFLWELWVYIAKKLEIKCNYHRLEGVITDKESNITYNKAIEYFYKHQDKYDVMINDFSVTRERENLVDFTRPVMLQKPVLIYIDNDLSRFFNLTNIKSFISYNTKPILILLAIAGILGLILHYSDKKSRDVYLSVFGTVGAFLAEPGTIVERTNPKNIFGVVASFIILLTAFYFAIFLQARATAHQVKDQSTNDPFVGVNGIEGKKFALPEGIAYISLIKQRGGIVKELKGDMTEDLYRKWINNKFEADGMVTTENYYETTLKGKYPLRKSNYQYGFDQIAFVTHHNNKELREAIDIEIIQASDNDISQKLCFKYNKNNLKACRI